MNPQAATPATPPRSTRQKRAVEAVIDASGDFRTAREIHELLRAEGQAVGLATVYRTLQALTEAGDVDTLKTDSGEALYRRCSQAHHHHLVCRDCGRTVEIKGPTVERWASTIATENGYADVSHTLELFGVCADCQRRSGASS